MALRRERQPRLSRHPPPSSHQRYHYIENQEFEPERPRTADGDMTNGSSKWVRRLPASPGSNSQQQIPDHRRSRSRDAASVSVSSLPRTPASPSSTGGGRFKKFWSRTTLREPRRSTDDDLSSNYSDPNPQGRSYLMMTNELDRGRGVVAGSFMDTGTSAVPVQQTKSTIITTHVKPLPEVVTVESLEAIEDYVTADVDDKQDRKGTITTIRSAFTTETAPTLPLRVKSFPIGENDSNNALDQAKERVNLLEEELRKARRAIDESGDQLVAYAAKDKESGRKMAELENALAAADQKVNQDSVTILQQEQRIERLRVQIADRTSKNALPASDIANLRVSEPEIIKRWQSLYWKVHNFVRICLKGMSDKKIKNWIDVEGDRLQVITPQCRQFALDKKAGLWFIEAAIWNILMERVFMHGNACWAGRYSKHIGRLSQSLLSTVQSGSNPRLQEDQNRKFHQWKAVTTSLLISLEPNLNDSRQHILMDVTEVLEDLLEPFGSSRRGSNAARELQDIVKEAIALDEVFCGQQGWYQLTYGEKSYDVPFEPTVMEVAAGGSSSSSSSQQHQHQRGGTVRFIIRPALWRSGGEGRDERYDAWCPLDRALVWT